MWGGRAFLSENGREIERRRTVEGIYGDVGKRKGRLEGEKMM